jgi:2,4-dienoyl-CoA reductase-like NADH-dependent reductase (Old Yellow Enzyme family)
VTDGGFRHLLAPGRIGDLELRNRIVMCPMGDALAEPDGTVSDRQVAYYGARARGGVGMVIMGSVSASYPYGCYDPRQTGASDDRFVPGLTRIAAEVHRHGARIAAQITHDAGNSRYDAWQGNPVLVPSVIEAGAPDRLSTMVTPEEGMAMMKPFIQPTSKIHAKAADEDDIAQLIEWFASCAERLIGCGFDGIELHAGHGYILDSFLSPAMNHRDDRWGGSVENRARLLLEVIGAVRQRIGRAVPLWMRINAEERHREVGETLPDTLRVIDMAVAAGLDAVHVTTHANPMVGVGICDSHTPQTPGHLRANFSAVKRSTTVPVIAFGRLEPELAEEVLASGDADFVAMGRQLLADPDLPRKLAAGERDDVRPCIYQYRCINNIFVNESVRCAVNPATAEGDEEAPPRAANPRHVLVVGAGPAGMETARLLAASGHRVTLADGATELGGRLVQAAAVDPQMRALLGWLRRQVERSDVELRLGERLDAVSTAAIGADVVVDATGTSWPGLDALIDATSALGVPAMEAVPLVEAIRADAVLASGDTSAAAAAVGGAVLAGGINGNGRGGSDTDAFDGAANVNGHGLVLVGGDKPAVALAVRARAVGLPVTVVEPGGVFALRVGVPGRARFVHDAEQAGVQFATEPPAGAQGFDVRPAPPIVLGHLGAHLVGDVTGTWGIEPAFQQARALTQMLAR